MVGPGSRPEDGVNIYYKDHTQGPVCAMACPAATVYRNYFYGPSGKGQAGGSSKQINTAEGVYVLVLVPLMNVMSHQYYVPQHELDSRGSLLPTPERTLVVVLNWHGRRRVQHTPTRFQRRAPGSTLYSCADNCAGNCAVRAIIFVVGLCAKGVGRLVGNEKHAYWKMSNGTHAYAPTIPRLATDYTRLNDTPLSNRATNTHHQHLPSPGSGLRTIAQY